MSFVFESLGALTQRTLPDDFIPVSAYDPDTGVFLCEDGHLGLCYWGDPVNGADDTTAEMLKGAFSIPLPAGSFVQVSLLGMPDIDTTIYNYRQRRENGLNQIQHPDAREVLSAYYERRADFIDSGKYEALLPSTGVKILDRKVVLTLKTPYQGLTPSEEDIEILAETGAKLAESLQAIGLFLRRMTAEQYLELAYRLTHPFDPPKTDPVRPEQQLNHQIFVAGESLDVGKDSLIFNDEVYAQILSVSRWPKSNALSLMAYMIGDPLGANNQVKLPYHINLTLHYPNQHEKVSAMRQKAGLINYQAFGPLLRFVPKLAFKKQGMDVLIHAIEQGATVVEAALTMTVYSKDKEEASRQVSAMRTYMQSFDMTMGEERRILLPVFWNAFPLFPSVESIKNTFRFKTMAVEHALTFVPILGEWKGTSRLDGKGHALLLASRRGQIMPIDLYDSSTNYNSVVFAESGSGKSFFTQQVIMDYLSMGAKVWVIDVGRSYYKLTRLLNGSFIEFGPTSGLCLNPFSSVTEIDEEVGLIQAIVEKMAAPEEGLDDYRRSRIEEAIKAVWGRMGTSSTITDVAEYMSHQPDPRVADIGAMLYRFTRYGSEGYWFDGVSNLDLTKDLVVLELEELKGKRTLQQVVLMQIISSIQREMYLSKDGRPKLLIIDEAWDLLDDPMVGRFMEHAYRRFRKYGGAAKIITQSIADLYRSSSGRAIADNSAFKFILRQTAESIDQVEREGYLALGPYGYYLLRTVHTIPGKYAEIMVYSNQGMGVSRLVVDRFSQVLFSTSGAERTEVINAIEAGATPLQAIEEFIATHG
ncbi:type IV secretion system protein TraC [Allochromatium humboldtianum]|uniref:Type IV secretion system protein TraC n=1 Tax=Allochromatium humboldtianum TaxID=504901 RepID=A0A850RK80_9GAMM|nr:type IV secretion system protein TraC [Allochromatium humboldtianum]NVZ11512.1 type IV secretion system protein TraC [Allochromatium humboldtianum]